MLPLHEIFIAPFSEFEFMRRALAGALALALGRGSHRRVPDAAPHVARGRRHGACDPAGRRGRIPGLRAQPVRHDRGRPDRGLRRRLAHRPGRAHDRAQGGRRARHLLSPLARARRHHRLAQGHQYRSPARAVRLGARARRPDAAADRRQRDADADRARPDLSAAGDRMRRSRLHALGQPRRRARRISPSSRWWWSISSPASMRSAPCWRSAS